MHNREGVHKGRARISLTHILSHPQGLEAILVGDWRPQDAHRVADRLAGKVKKAHERELLER